MFELIPSNDTREFLMKIGHTFTDFENATLIFNNRFAADEDKIQALRSLLAVTEDITLAGQIKERIEDMHGQISNPEGRFEESYVRLPHPFRQGDIVHIIWTDKLGIVTDCKDDAEVKEYDDLMKGMMRSKIINGNKTAISTYGDCQICVKTYFDGTTYLSEFSHEHVNPIDLEYANLTDDDSRKGYLEYIKQKLLYHSLFGGKGRNPKRIPAVLEQVKRAWEKYPDLRLGQLIANCKGDGIFGIEDEQLMEQLQKFMDT